MSPQKENGYTPIANELFEAFFRCKLLEYERVIMMCIWRKTYGWNKKEDWIANSQFFDETGIPKPHITRTLKLLIKKKIVTKDSKKVSINKKYWLWGVEWRVTSPGNKVTSPGNKKLPHQVPTKEKKDIIQKRAKAQEKLKANQSVNMAGFNKYGDDYEFDPIQIDPEHKAKKAKKSGKASEDQLAVFELFNNPAKGLWRMREIEREAAQILFDTYGLETLKRRLGRIESEKQKKDPFLPQVDTPSELLDKMPKVERYLNI